MQISKIKISRLCLVLVLFFGCLFFAGCGDMVNNQAIENGSSELKMEVAENVQAKPSFVPNITFADLLSSIKQDEKLDCRYLVEDEDTLDDVEAHIYIEGEKYKSITYTKGGDTLYSIFDGETFYSWSKLQGQGFKMSKSCAGRFAVSPGGEDDQDDGEDFELDSYKTSSELFDDETLISCEATSYVDIAIPAEISFADQCSMLENQIEQIKQLQNNQ